jgi:hypothetical protein
MTVRNILFATIMVGAMTACSGVGVVETDDPYDKLRQAQYLYSGPGRAMRARQLINEAVQIFEKQGDETGLAEAYRQYGFLARCGGARDAILIRGGCDRASGPVPPEDIRLSDQYFVRAEELAIRHNRYDLLSNIYFNLNINRYFADDRAQACIYLDKALEASRRAETARPGAPVELPRGVGSFAELVANSKAKIGGCS